MATSQTPQVPTPEHIREDLENLLKVDPSARNDKWEHSFLQVFPHLKLQPLEPQPKQGPDGWPYLLIETKAPQEVGDPVPGVIKWLSERGIGLAVNPQKSFPDFVFTYGMIWNFRERAQFITPSPRVEQNLMDIKPGEQLYTGAPSPSYFPLYVRRIIKQFWLDQGVTDPKVLLVSRDKTHFDFCFSLESIGTPPENEWQGILEAIAWFFPAHYSLGLLSEKVVKGFASI